MQFYCNNFLVKLDLMSAEKSCNIIMPNKLLTIPGAVFRFSDFYLQHEFTVNLCYLCWLGCVGMVAMTLLEVDRAAESCGPLQCDSRIQRSLH